MFAKLESIERRFVHLEDSLLNPNLDSAQLKKLTKERAEIEGIVAAFREYKSVKKERDEAREMLESGESDLRDLAQDELAQLEEKLSDISQRLTVLLLPTDPRDNRNVILEIRAGTGGDEASLFASELLRMYSRYAEKQRWKVEILSTTESSRGGIKEVIVLIEGARVYSRLKFEMGAHRVQRVPVTEAQGRVHTSACTVAVLPEAEEVEVNINPADLRVDTYRASGAGGQHVNRTDSAVRITHIPTGTVVECQDERSQHKNRDKAMKMLRSRIYEQMQQKADQERSQDRKLQVGTGDRSERIRTYNFPQGRVTDHRINLTLYQLPEIMNGDLDEILDSLGTYHTTELLKSQSAHE